MLAPNAPLVLRHLELHELFAGKEHEADDLVLGRRLVLGIADVRICCAVSGLGTRQIKLAWSGTEPLVLADGSTRSLREDGDVATTTAAARGSDGSRIDLGNVTAAVIPSEQQ